MARDQGTVTIIELRAALNVTVEALERAIHKHRIDFDPYWVWFDGERAEALRVGLEALKKT